MTTTSTTVRLPRFRRTEADVSFALTPRDLQILQTVESFRLLDSEHIQALTQGSAQNILRRLQTLYHAGLLDRLAPRFTPGGGSRKMIYAVTNKGIAALQKEGLLKAVSKTDRNAANRGLRRESVDHRLLISHIRAMFMLACQAEETGPNSGQNHAMFSGVCQAHQPARQEPQAQANPSLRFLYWKEGRELYDKIEVALPNSYAQIPVAPDGFLALGDAQGRRAHFLVEADRGSMTLKRVILKLQAYAAWRRQKRQEAKLGIKNFRVLTVTTSAARCRNLAEAASTLEDVRQDARMFLFAAEQYLRLASPENVLEKIWRVPGVEEPQALFRECVAQNPILKGDPSPAVL